MRQYNKRKIDQKDEQAIIDLPVGMWVKLCLLNGVELMPGQDIGVGMDNFTYPVKGEETLDDFILDYLPELPEEKLNEIAHGLAQTVTLD